MDMVPIRMEVIDAQRQRNEGAIILARPVPLRLASLLGTSVLATLIALLVFGNYTSKERVTGQITPAGGSIKVIAPQFGRIIKRKAREGDHILKGQILFEISAERVGANGSVDARVVTQMEERRQQAQARSNAALAQLEHQRRSFVAQRRVIEGEIVGHRGAISIQSELIKSARENLNRYITLAKTGFVSAAQLGQYRNALSIELAKSEALRLNLAAAQRSLAQVDGDISALSAQTGVVQAEAAAAQATLLQEVAEHEGRNTFTITAPSSGVITALAYAKEQTVSAGSALAVILPDGVRLEAQLSIPTRARAAVEQGQQVYIRIDAFPYQKFGMIAGTIREIEHAPVADSSPSSPPQYRAAVELQSQSIEVYGKRKNFEPGMTLEADIFNDRRRLIDWVIDPLLAVSKNRAP